MLEEAERATQELADLRAAVAAHRAELTNAALRWTDAAGLPTPGIVSADVTLWEEAGLETQQPYSDVDPVGRLLGLVDTIRDDVEEWRSRCQRYARAIDLIDARIAELVAELECERWTEEGASYVTLEELEGVVGEVFRGME